MAAPQILGEMKNSTTQRSPVELYLGLGGFCLLAALLAGVGTAILYARPGGNMPTHLFPVVRRLHVGWVLGWIFLSALGVIIHVIGDRARFPGALRVSGWIVAALTVGFSISTLLGWTSGREYIFFPAVFSPAILLVWGLLFANFIDYFGRWPTRHAVKKEDSDQSDASNGRPIWLWMWLAGFLLFFGSFIEIHAHLLTAVRRSVIRDIALQWKSYGTLIGSWNMLIYGAALWAGSRLLKDLPKRPGRLEWALFGLALLNSLTNFAHHTYHLPMSLAIRKFSFVVSMSEAIILAKVLFDLMRAIVDRRAAQEASKTMPRLFLSSATFWNAINLMLALAISIPAINGLTHGTYVTVAHVMGSMIGINTFLLIAAIALVLSQRSGNMCLSPPRGCKVRFIVANLSLALFLGCLFRLGIERGLAQLAGSWSVAGERTAHGILIALFVLSGTLLAGALGSFAAHFIRAAWRIHRPKSGCQPD